MFPITRFRAIYVIFYAVFSDMLRALFPYVTSPHQSFRTLMSFLCVIRAGHIMFLCIVPIIELLHGDLFYALVGELCLKVSVVIVFFLHYNTEFLFFPVIASITDEINIHLFKLYIKPFNFDG